MKMPKKNHITIDKISQLDKIDSSIYLISTLLLDLKKDMLEVKSNISSLNYTLNNLKEMHKAELKDFFNMNKENVN